MTEKATVAVQAPKQPKHRSPNYPVLSLGEAVARVRTLYEADGKYGSDPETVVRHLGYSGITGQSRMILSALRKFGLVEERNKRIVPSERALDILVYGREQEAHLAALEDAALEPVIYRSLWEQYSPQGRLPSELSIKQHLIRGLDFNPKAVDGFLQDFKATLEYAGLLDGNKLLRRGDQQGEVTDDIAATPSLIHQTVDRQPVSVPAGISFAATSLGTFPTSGSGQSIVPFRTLSIPLPQNRIMLLQAPADLTEGDVDFAADYLRLLKRTLITSTPAVAPPPPGAAQVRTGPALWRTKDFDHPVVVLGWAGERGGRHYVQVEGSTTGVPVDEIVYEAPVQ